MPILVDYDKVAPFYDRRYEDYKYGGIQDSVFEFVGRALTNRVLEVGCGTGYWLALLGKRGFTVAGLDLSINMLRRSKARLPDVALVLGEAEKLPWSDSFLDRIICINSFHHFSSKEAFLSEAYRVLRSHGGILTIGLDPHVEDCDWYIYKYFDGIIEIDKDRYPAASQIRNWLNQACFEQCTTTESEHISLRLDAEAALSKGQLDNTRTSQLTILTEQEYRLGIERIRRDINKSKMRGRNLLLISNLRLYATSAWKK